MPDRPTALFRIEKGDPPRRITVDELVAFGQVFNLEPSDLLRPVEMIARQEALELFEKMRAAEASLVETIDEVLALMTGYLLLAQSGDDLDEYMTNHVDAHMAGPDAHASSVEAHKGAADAGPDPIGEAFYGLLAAIMDRAKEMASGQHQETD